MSPFATVMVISLFGGLFWAAIVTCAILVVRSDARPPSRQRGWTITGFDNLLEGVRRAKTLPGNLKPTVTHHRTGKVYAIDLFEVRENPDGTIERVGE